MKTVSRWAVVLVAAVACGGEAQPPEPAEPAPAESPAPPEEDEATLSITSSAFEEGDTVPTEFTCEGDDNSPPLEWSGVPEDAAELQLTLTDPDAPSGTFTHWVVTGIDPASAGVGAGEVPEGGTEEENSFGETAYGGPCPPAGPAHTYIWTLEAVSEDNQVISAGVLTAEFGT